MAGGSEMSSGISQRELRGIGTHFDLRKCGFPKVPCPTPLRKLHFQLAIRPFPRKEWRYDQGVFIRYRKCAGEV